MSEADNVDVAAEATVTTEAPVAERPEWLPEKFNTPEDLASSYQSLEQKLGTGQEELRQQIIQEFETAAYENRPATAGDYQIPESVDAEMAVDNPLFQWWADHAFENAYSQEEFESGIAQYAEFINSQTPDLQQERANLGDNADARIEAVDLWANKFFPEEHADAILQIGQTSKGIEALEFIMSKVGGVQMSADAGLPTGMTEDKLRSMMNDERYWNAAKRDPAYVKEVQAGFSKVFN
jgi:hypothetical protein